MTATPSPKSHRWSFYRAGGVDQVRLDTGADILALDELDQKLWVALSCPVKGLEIDERTLQLLDSDGDAHVRPPEILAAVKWLREALQNADAMAKGTDGLQLANLRKDTAEGKALFASATHILKSLGKEATVITVADTAKTADVFAQGKRNGDGVVPPETIDDAKVRAAATDIITCMGGVTDRSGKPGFDQAKLDAFLAACADFDAWHKAAEADAKNVMPLGASTGAAYAAFAAVRGKIDDFFGRCRLAAFDPRSLNAVNREQDAYIAAAAKDLTITASEVAHFPLAIVEANKALPLTKALNPAWAGPIAAFRDACCKDKETLTEADWSALCGKLAAHGAWLGKKAGAAAEALGIARVREILASNAKAGLQQAITDDLAVAGEVDAMARVEKLVRLQRDFARLLNNYVSFTDFYARRGAIFQAGTLYLDGRAMELCFHVHDGGKHGAMASMSKTYLAYVDCTRPGMPKMQVACAFTAGDSDNLFVGRNGIFYDRKGRDWDATISKIVDNPISIGQAFWSPYKKLMRWIEEQVNKRAAAAESASSDKLTAAASKVGDAAATGKPAEAKKFDPSVVALFSVAIASITGVFGTIIAVFAGMGAWMPIGILGVILGISGPSMLIAWMKLRQRNLGPILDANGWAVNTMTKVNIPLGGSLTELPKIPAGSARSLVDPYAEKKSIWPTLLLWLLALAAIGYGLYRTNVLHKLLPDYPWLQHHVENALLADKDSGVAGDAIVLTVRSSDDELEVYDDAGKLIDKPKVAAGKATLAIPAAMKAGVLIVRDGASATEVTITVTEKK